MKTVMSLFDGARMGMASLKLSGRSIGHYYASEIDESAKLVANDNFPFAEELGDVTKWRDWDVDWSGIDLLIGGSPCQGFSICGKQLAFEDPRSALIKDYIDILNHIKNLNPNVLFLLENVKMSQENMEEVNKLLGVDAMLIDSKAVGPAMRKRYYWFNWECAQPDDSGISFQSILENGFVEKEKSWCPLESWNRFPKKTESAKGRYKRSMMPIIFTSPDFDWDKGWREPSITEVERMMGVPDGYCKAVKPKVGKGILGNGWECRTLSHIFKAMP
ncbi:C-5 cytosine-specific DNA methylase [Vibrio phage 1.148.O._10N.286.54.A10]|nr:C-5 cytosine-specific DNA methylase [Vibrio phage 1.148.O._10N.286.54.A10]